MIGDAHRPVEQAVNPRHGIEYAEANAELWPSYWVPILLEVARTAVAADEALIAFEQWKPRCDGLVDDSFMPLLEAARATRAAHRAALGKLKP